MFLFLFEVAALPTEIATRSSAVDFSLLFFKMVAALIVACVAAILILKFVLPRLSIGRKNIEIGRIKILSRFSVGPKQHLLLVKVDEKCILLGVTDGSITKITDVDNQNGIQETRS